MHHHPHILPGAAARNIFFSDPVDHQRKGFNRGRTGACRDIHMERVKASLAGLGAERGGVVVAQQVMGEIVMIPVPYQVWPLLAKLSCLAHHVRFSLLLQKAVADTI